MTLISLADVAVDFGALSLLHDVTFTVSAGDRWGIVGRNGTGKSTLFNIIAGAMEPTRGSVSRASGLKLALLDQHRAFPDDATIWEIAAGPFAELLALEQSLGEQGARIAELGDRCTPALLDRYDRDLDRFGREDGYRIGARVDAVLHGLGFDPEEAKHRTVAGLSGGERGRLGLVRQLAARADLLLLDEPTNHLDLETTRWLEEYLRALDATVLVISHDRAFLSRVIDHVLHIEAGTGFVYHADYERFVRQRTERRLSEGRAVEKQRRTVAAEEDFIRRNIAGQNSRQAKGRRRRLERVVRLSAPVGDADAMALRLQAPDRGGDQVLVAERVRLAVGDRTLLKGFSARVGRGEVVGLLGPNGAGKSTLLQAIAGERQVNGGELRRPESITTAYYRQDLAQVPTDRTLYETIADLRPTWGRGPIQDHLGRFGFSGDAVLRRADTLSGGERARVALAMLMLTSAHLLLFDEPTNHLDVESIEALEDALESYDGTVILVSHDRALLRAITTRTWILRDEAIIDYPAGFADWEIAEAEQAADASARAAAGRSRSRAGARPTGARARANAGPGAAAEPERGRASAERTARRALESAESLVSAREAELDRIRTELAAPELYARADSAQAAAALGLELEAAQRALHEALEQWLAVSEAIEGSKRD